MPSNSPYSPSQDTVSLYPLSVIAAELEKKKKFWKIAAWASAGLILIPLSLGFITSMIWLRKAFEDMGKRGISSPEVLSVQIGEALIATAASLILAVPFLTFFIISLIRFRSYREKILSHTAGGFFS